MRTRTGQIWAFGVSSKVTYNTRAICQRLFSCITTLSRSTHPADGEEQTLQVCELGRREAKKTGGPVSNGTGGTLVPRECVCVAALVQRESNARHRDGER